LTRIAIVGIGCQYAEANSPSILWRNVLSARRSFREIPAERIDLAAYHSYDRFEPDKTYSRYAAVLEDYEFDRLAFSIPGPLFRSSDMVHWLALDVAKRALDDAGFDQLQIDRRRVSVLIGNTLTGDRTRSETLRVRWPYVRRAVAATLVEHGLSSRLSDLLADLERRYKEPFTPITEETLAGGLSNTIAGRICNYFDFGGGGYTIDGACSSSLLSIIQASISLLRHDVDFALAGGVDLSIDPFELVGFSKTGALAEQLMRIYDVQSEGFWPGEGCGIVALVREEDAKRWDMPVYAFVAGFGVSSDGHGGITRPEADGHLLAMRRAYDLATYGPDTVSLFEGHGTGTRVGDAAEVAAISLIRREAGARSPAALGSIKANIGHTKAAAGVAGFTKVVMSLHAGVIPPTTGCQSPLEPLTVPDRVLEIKREAVPWPTELPRRASVSAVGFGGINTHVTIEKPSKVVGGTLWPTGLAVASTAQNAELLPLTADSLTELADRCRRMSTAARELSFGRMADLAINAVRELLPGQQVRAAVVARTPVELSERCGEIAERIQSGMAEYVSAQCAFSVSTSVPRIGYLFSGQGSPVRFTAGALGRRFAAAENVIAAAALERTNPEDTGTAQPAIVTSSAAALAVLDEIGVEACVAVGHSLGELAALFWAGLLTRDELFELAKVRGRAMSSCGPERGSMVQLNTDETGARELMTGLPLSIAAINAADLTVISGPEVAVQAALRRAATRRIPAALLRVSHAFHSPLVAPAAEAIAAWFGSSDPVRPLRRQVVSTVTGAPLRDRVSPERLLVDQVTAPVLFQSALEQAAEMCDLLVEVGPGHILTDLSAPTGLPAVTVDAGAEDIAPFLGTIGAAFALGSPVDLQALVRDRVSFSADPLRRPTYLSNPCELTSTPQLDLPLAVPQTAVSDGNAPGPEARAEPGADEDVDIFQIVRDLIAAKTELPGTAIGESSTFLADLNLSSIAIAEIAADAAKAARRQLLQAPHELTDGSVKELVDLLTASPVAGEHDSDDTAGVDDWVRAFQIQWEPKRRSGLRRAVSWRLADECGDGLRAIFPSQVDGQAVSARGKVIALGHIGTDAAAWRAVDSVARIAMDRDVSRVVICHAGGAASLARTLYTERPDLTVRLISAADVEKATSTKLRALIRRECETGDGFEELRFTRSLQVLVPRLRACRIEGVQQRLSSDDTILVSGGGRGIGAEAALNIGKEFGVKIAILGRSVAEKDDEIQANIARMTALGIRVHYERADITDRHAVEVGVRRIEKLFGPVTGILHSAGVNTPTLLRDLTPDAVSSAWGPKVGGLTNLIAAVDPGRLRLLVAFGSIIGRSGMRGEAHYAIANERLRTAVEAFAGEHPSCHCLAIEWSVWSGVGMGAKLGIVDSLSHLGVRPISLEHGLNMLHALITAAGAGVSPIVCGRIGQATRTLPMHEHDLPFLRFIETPIVYYPEIELVADAAISGETDRYLSDHAVDGTPLFPVVAGIEAMAQIAQALSSGTRVSRIAKLRMRQVVTAPVNGSRRIRIAGLVGTDGLIDVSIRSDETDFLIEHFSATYEFDSADQQPAPLADRPDLLPDSADIVRSLYTDLLFHGPSFQQVRGFRRLEASLCRADVSAHSSDRWFLDYLPQDLLLGDLAARDACLHAAQACIPHRRMLPVSAEEIRFASEPGTALVDVESTELSRGDRDLAFDLTVRDEMGELVETWTGLRLRAVGDVPLSHPLPPDVLAAYVERSLGLRWGHERICRVAIKNTSTVRRNSRGELAVSLATGGAERLSHRPDGAPALDSGLAVSLSHHEDLTLVVLSDAQVGADLEAVEHRPEATWQGMLGPGAFSTARLLAASSGQELDVCATRVWSAIECLRKIGVDGDMTLLIDTDGDATWTSFMSGKVKIHTVSALMFGANSMVVIAAACSAAASSLAVR
jgi:enediyne polyketide synthase